MTVFAKDLWRRAKDALAVARRERDFESDVTASRSYYAAFYAVSALFALEEKSFTKHSAVEAAVHRDLVKTGRWPAEAGEAYSTLLKRRTTGDYGMEKHVEEEDAADSIVWAERIMRLVADASGGVLRLEDSEGRGS